MIIDDYFQNLIFIKAQNYKIFSEIYRQIRKNTLDIMKNKCNFAKQNLLDLLKYKC